MLLFLLFAEVGAQKKTTQDIDAMISRTFRIADRNQALAISNEAYRLSEDMDYYPGMAKALKADINSYLGLGEQEKALISSEKLYKIAKKHDDDYHCAQALIAKSLACAYIGFFDKALKTIDEAEEYCKDIKDNDDLYSSLGQVYAAKGEINNLKYESPQITLKYDLASVEYYKKIKDAKKRNGWLAIQYSSVGYTYIDLDDYAPAVYYSRKSYDIARQEKDSINQAFGLYGLGSAYMEMNQSDSSIYYYKQALPIFEKSQDIYRQQYIYEDLSTLYEKLGDDRVYAYYSKKARELSEEIRKKEKIETDKISKNILEQEKNQWYDNFFVLICCIVVLVVLTIFMAVNYFKRYRTEKMQKEQTEFDLIEKESELNHLESKVNDAFAELMELANSNDSSFLSRFTDVYPAFYNRLIEEYPTMTAGQQKFCALLKLNFSTKEIAHISHISVRSVEMKKNRLRKQLSIPSDVDLNQWMMSF